MALTDALNARDLERVIELSSPELEFHSVVATAEGRVFRGLAGLREWAESVDSTLADYRVELEEVHRADDGRTVVVYAVAGTGRASGVPLDVRIGQLWTWRDGRPWRNDVFSDPAEAFRAAGLDPAG